MSHSDPIASTHIEPNITEPPLSQPPQHYTYYHAGPLFSVSDLTTNTRLANAISGHSHSRYRPIMPQDLEQRDTSPHSIRDCDIKALLSCDLALFTYDGSELDSGTVVEYMVAKFADIPTVILRTDFRGGGDQGASNGDPWNLMSSFWPRSVGVVIDSMLEYKTALAATQQTHEGSGIQMPRSRETVDLPALAGNHLIDVTAKKVVEAFETVIRMPPRLPKELRQSVYQWLALMPGLRDGSDEDNIKDMLKLMQQKQDKGLY